MPKPEELIEFLDNLEPDQEKVQTVKSSKAIIHVGNEPLVLNAEDCEKIFGSCKLTQKFFKLIGEPETLLELHGVEMETEVFDLLEEIFDAVEVY
jgi:hypothetical protein